MCLLDYSIKFRYIYTHGGEFQDEATATPTRSRKRAQVEAVTQNTLELTDLIDELALPVDDQHLAADYDMDVLFRGAFPMGDEDDDTGEPVDGPSTRTRAQRAADHKEFVGEGRQILLVNLANYNKEHEPITGRLSNGKTRSCMTCVVNKIRKCTTDMETALTDKYDLIIGNGGASGCAITHGPWANQALRTISITSKTFHSRTNESDFATEFELIMPNYESICA